ncbi:MAG: helix-turn-helix transcriptional regulator [Anaerolineales bacterium]|nr:helix-turn-helix transcriptional regulator [Anaerolineales bacterium]
MSEIQQVRKGSTSLLILSVLLEGPSHGYAIMRKLEERSNGYFKMTAALLYPTLHQMEQEHLIESVWENAVGQRRKKIYTITPKGKEHLTKGNTEWKRFFDQLFNVMDYSAEAKKVQ